MKEAYEKSTMVSCSRRFLTSVKRDTAVVAVDLESRNKFCWDLLLQHAVRSLVGLAIAACSEISGAANINSQSLPRSRSRSRHF